MDPLTHTLFGAALAKAGLGRRTAFGTATLVIGANLPDLDVLAYFRGADFALGFRRGWTHGVAALVVLPLLLWLTVMLFDRRMRRPRGHDPPASSSWILGLAYLGVLSHPCLDWLNNYGVRWLMPFDGTWFYGDTLFIVDPWLWLVLGGVVWLGRPGRRAAAALAVAALLASVLLLAGPGVPAAAKVVWVVGLVLVGLFGSPFNPMAMRQRSFVASGFLVAAMAYIIAMLIATRIAVDRVRTDVEARGIGPVTAAMVGPVVADPLRRDVVVATDREYHYGTFRWLDDPHLDLEASTLPMPPDNEIVRAAFRAPGVQGFVDWVRFPFVEVEEDGEHYRVFLLDARYTRGRIVGFGGASALLGRDDLEVVEPP